MNGQKKQIIKAVCLCEIGTQKMKRKFMLSKSGKMQFLVFLGVSDFKLLAISN